MARKPRTNFAKYFSKILFSLHCVDCLVRSAAMLNLNCSKSHKTSGKLSGLFFLPRVSD